MQNDTQTKKNILVAWYGITDLRAAMGITKQGPILGVLRTGNFSEAKILCYTKKDLQGINLEEQKEYAELLQANRETNAALSTDEVWYIQDKFANTPAGHDFFLSWLKNELQNIGASVAIDKIDCYLDKLNDSHGIYVASLNTISSIRKQYGDQAHITLFITPGTPVMAFSWALAALVNSDMQIDILVSPDMRKDAEFVELPYKLTDSSLKNTNLSHPEKFDVIFHLYGEQAMPAVLGILQFDCSNHVFITSEGYNTKRLQYLLKSQKEYLLITDPFSPQKTKETILNFIKQHPEWKTIGFNLTGGTKLMYSGAMSACNQCFGIPFYFETKTNQMLWLSDYSTAEIASINEIDVHLPLSRLTISCSGRWEDDPNREFRKELTLKIWEWRSEISNIYKAVAQYNDRPGQAFTEYHKNICAVLDKNNVATLTLGDYSFTIPDCPDFAEYISGGWFEEYTYLQLKPLLDAGDITDIRIGLDIGLEEEKQIKFQEFDIVFTDGKRLYFLECKAGAYKSEDVQKLQDNVRHYGGVNARGAMVTCFPPSGRLKQALLRRIEDAKDLAIFIGEAVPEFLASRIQRFSGNAIYSTPSSGKSSCKKRK